MQDIVDAEQNAEENATSTTSSSFKLLDYIKELKTNFDINYEFNFSILIEQSPIERKYTYVGKVLGIIVRSLDGKSRQVLNYDELVDCDMKYVEVKKLRNQKIGIETPTFIDGCSVIKNFKGHDFLEFNFRFANKKQDAEAIKKIRETYKIPVPYKFKSTPLHF